MYKFVILFSFIPLFSQAQYFTFENEGDYCLEEEYILLDGKEIEGYWIDSIFNAGRIQYIFKEEGVTKLTKLFQQGTVYKNCSVFSDSLDSEPDNITYWSVSKEYLGNKIVDYLLGFEGFEIKPTLRLVVTNVRYNMNNGTLRAEQNGIPFYLWNSVESMAEQR